MRKTLCLCKYTANSLRALCSEFPVLPRMKNLNMLAYVANVSLVMHV